jgi:hypothetical protein
MLATAVIKLAVVDAAWQPTRTPRTKKAAILHGRCMMHQANALAFIDGAMLDLWCHIGGFDVARVRHAIKAALRDGLHHLDIGHHYTPRRRAA